MELANLPDDMIIDMSIEVDPEKFLRELCRVLFNDETNGARRLADAVVDAMDQLSAEEQVEIIDDLTTPLHIHAERQQPPDEG